MNEIVLERMLSWQVVQANCIQSMLIGGKEKPRPTMRPVAYRVPMDGKVVTVACCNLGVMADYGLELGWIMGWCSDNCNGAVGVSNAFSICVCSFRFS